MRKYFSCLTIFILLLSSSALPAQKKIQGSDLITSEDLESYVSFLASPLLQGRMNGEPGLEIAQEFIASNAKILGLKPANGSSFFQPYTIIQKKFDSEKTKVQVIPGGGDTLTITKPIYQSTVLE